MIGHISLVIVPLVVAIAQNIGESMFLIIYLIFHRRDSSSSSSNDDDKRLKKSHLKDIDRKIREARKKEEHEKRMQEMKERLASY